MLRNRKSLLGLYTGVILISVPVLTFLYFFTISTVPFQSQYNKQTLTLEERILELDTRLKQAEDSNYKCRQDLVGLRKNIGETPELSHKIRETLWRPETDVVDDLYPSLHHYLPYLGNVTPNLQPLLHLSQGRKGVSTVFGVPTVKRDVQSYLPNTLENLIENMTPEERSDSLIIVFIAELDENFVSKQVKELQDMFKEHIESGLLEVMAPPTAFYPNFNNLELTLGDNLDRVKWRSKQNLDYAYLMLHAYRRGTYYLQLEDDVLTKPNYLNAIVNFLGKQKEKKWVILDFCQLGFIGKLFKSVDLPRLIAFFLIFYNDKPVDWLLDNYIQTKMCRFDKTATDCKKQKESVWIKCRPSLFQHIGTHSSLKGKVQKLKDRQFGKIMTYKPHKDNPKAVPKTTLKIYLGHTLERAYSGETFFWGLSPKKGDTFNFEFSPNADIESFLLRSGSIDSPFDLLENVTVGVSLKQDGLYFPISLQPSPIGEVKGLIATELRPVKDFRITFHEDLNHWVILNEIYFKNTNVSKAQ